MKCGLALAALVALASMTVSENRATPTRVALTFDDLPWSGPVGPDETPRSGLQRIAAVLRVHDAPATGFVVCDRVAGQEAALETWVSWGLPLGNHSASHADLEQTDVGAWLADVARCDSRLRRFGDAATRFFRYPMLHQGSPNRRDTARAGLDRLGLRIAHVSVDTSDWLLARAYTSALAAGDANRRLAIGRAFVHHVADALDHADGVARRKLGRSLPHVLLLHANSLVADHLDALLLELRKRGLRSVSLDEALSDPAYARRDAYAGPRGLSWLYRMEPATPEDARWDDAQAAEIERRFPRPAATTERSTPSRRLGPFWLAPDGPPALRAALEMAGVSERMRSLLVMHRGRLVAEAYYGGADASRPTNLKSVTKSLTAALVGVALERGWIASLDDPVARYLPDAFVGGRHADKAGITLRHLLTMTSGLNAPNYDAFQHSADTVEALLAPPLARAPGAVHVYDTPAVQLLTAVLRQSSGLSARTLADRELLGPLGAELAYWRCDAGGIEYGGNDAFLRPRDLIRLGELYRLGGVYRGRRILSEAFVRMSVSPLVPTGEPTVNHGTLRVRGYGLLWWVLAVQDDDAFAALGHGGQELLVFPSRELVVLMTSRWPGESSTEHYQHLLRVLRDGVLPAFPRGAASPPPSGPAGQPAV